MKMANGIRTQNFRMPAERTIPTQPPTLMVERSQNKPSH